MALNLFVLNGVDYTSNILNETYDVHKNDVSEEWTDADYVDHKETVRTRIEGTFTMRFRSLVQYEAFVQKIAESKASDQTFPCVIWANNTLDSNEADLFIKFAPKAVQKANLVMDYREFEVTVKEA